MTTPTIDHQPPAGSGQVPGPLYVNGTVADADRSIRIDAEVEHRPFNEHGWRPSVCVANGPQKEANAARLVACWNACLGIPDPSALRRQRDELLSACKALIGTAHVTSARCGFGRMFTPKNNPCDCSQHAAYNEARAAIAACEVGNG